MDDTLLTIITESFSHAFFLPIGQNVTFDALYWFGKVSSPQIIASGIGAVLGCVANWIFGLVLSVVRSENSTVFPQERYESIGRVVRRYGVWLLMFYWQPFGAILMIVAGLFRVPWWQVLVSASFGAVLELYFQYPSLWA